MYIQNIFDGFIDNLRDALCEQTPKSKAECRDVAKKLGKEVENYSYDFLIAELEYANKK